MKKIIVLILGLVLAGCAVKQKSQQGKVVYQAPPPPKTFDLEVYPGDHHLFKVGDMEYTYNSMRIYINSHKGEAKGLFSVLFHVEILKKKMRKFHETVCFSFLMIDTNVAGYWNSKDGITPVSVVDNPGGSYGMQMLHRQCRGE